jgi:ABC-type lipoprotein export system ATPase subunit
MIMTLKRIGRKGIFTESFKQLTQDNELIFPESGIIVVYGPNGVGKSSLASVFAKEPETEFALDFDGNDFTSTDTNSLFHVINDQNGRNIIQGSTEDFILGDNIRREYELKKAIENGFEYLFNSLIIPKLKSDFGISKKDSPLLEKICDKTLARYVSDLANIRSKGKRIDRSEFLSFIETLCTVSIANYDESKLRFLVNDYNAKTSITKQLIEFTEKNIIIDHGFVKVEECTDAITLLTKYYYLHECVVCDKPIERISLLEKKQKDKDSCYKRLDKATKGILEQIHNSIGEDDPFAIKQAVTESAISGKLDSIVTLLKDFVEYFEIVNKQLNNFFAGCLKGLDLISRQREYGTIISEKPELTSEDVLYIEKFVNNCIDRKIELQRDSNGNLELLLGQKKFLNEDRKSLSLSNGEQNFISIAFELLKAKKVEAKVIVLDDPISSFDSIFKNKIAYAIVKFLNQKKQILLTHNTDLIMLLEHQRSQSFNLYIMNNTIGERNGFIPITREEQSLLLYLNKLVDFFREGVKEVIKDERKYLMAMVPFMRSFSQIMNRPMVKENLTGIMHGYGTTTVDLTATYNELFGCSFLTKTNIVSVDDILDTNLAYWEIIDSVKYPMLNRTFVHILTYLYLRLKVEKTLVEKYNINTNRYDMLTRIIDKAFKEDNFDNVQRRVFLLSRKTLLNEFNHFEQGLNIFQPALDITDTALKKERDDILQFLKQL